MSETLIGGSQRTLEALVVYFYVELHTALREPFEGYLHRRLQPPKIEYSRGSGFAALRSLGGDARLQQVNEGIAEEIPGEEEKDHRQ